MDEMAPSTNVVSGFASHLATLGLLDKGAAVASIQKAAEAKISYIDYLVKQKLLEESVLSKTVSGYFGFPYLDIAAFNFDLIPKEYLNIQLTKRKQALPLFKKAGLLYLAVTDPTIEHLYDLRFLTGLEVRLFIVDYSKLNYAIDDMLSNILLS